LLSVDRLRERAKGCISDMEVRMSKRVLFVGTVVAVMLVVAAAGCTSDGETAAEGEAGANGEYTRSTAVAPSPSVAAASSVVQLHGDTKVVLTGSGFDPGQELRLLLTTEQGGIRAVSDFTYAADPEPVANEEGAWVTAWGVFGRLFDKEVITDGVYAIVVTDTDNNPVATTSVAFYDPEKPQEEWPVWANVEASE